jgi:hypothetical protein
MLSLKLKKKRETFRNGKKVILVNLNFNKGVLIYNNYPLAINNN